jgi:hypothetical protein
VAGTKGAAAGSRSADLNFAWPADEEGNPMVLVTMQASELIGLPNYSNVTVGPASVTRFVKADAVAEGLKTTAQEVEKIIAEERELVLDIVKKTA